MAAFDLAKLRNQTLADGQDSEVTVNTRALIDKVLARYSSEHTTLRELIQNASDAAATTVVIKFETDPSATIPVPQGGDQSLLLKHVIQNHALKRLTVSNNGQPFTTADWNRLKSIADGNPDETKIGAFGVGFYSVFSDCDEPFVVSGDKTMAFYWKGNTLSTKMATVPPEHASSNTTFSLDYRQANPASPSYNPSKIPNLPGLCQFLATSLTFVGLQAIELHLDEFKVASFTKTMSAPSTINVPQGLKIDTEGGLMRVKDVTRQQSQITAEWSNVIATAQNPPKRAAELVQAEMKNAGNALKSFFSKFSAPAPAPKISKPQAVQEKAAIEAEDISGESKGVIFLQSCTVQVDTRVTRSFSAEIERATKKPPPRSTRIAILTSPYKDPSVSVSSGSGNTADLVSKIFQEVLPTKSGRIFIGFPTAQTTPFLAHVSAPSLIPTVERENVDMNARYISTWNKELLRVAGLACRISYSLDMADVRDRVGKEELSAIIPQAVYVCKQYTPSVSHPSKLLGETMVEAFFNCSKERAIAVLSTTGVKSSQYVRMPAETLSFLRDVPMVPQELATEAVAFFVSLHSRGFISEMTMADIRDGLDSRALSEEELIEFLKWCGAKLEGEELDASGVRNLFEVTVANVGVTPEGNSGKILSLDDIKYYVNASRIDPALPVPPDTIPFAFSKAVHTKQLAMFGWAELSMVRWLQFMTSPPRLQEFSTSEALATKVLGSASKCWDQLDNASKDSVVRTLKAHPVMPTKMGIRRPEDSYFPTVKIFDDLPTVKPFVGSKEKFLLALGVRKTVDLPTVFERMKSQDAVQGSEKSSWNLIQYFASVLAEIPKKDFDRLREMAFLPGEGRQVKPGQLFKAQDLFAPDQAILSLGLSQLKWKSEFKANTKEATLLFRLGLKRHPDSVTLATILHRAGQAKDFQLWTLAMEYFLNNYHKNSYVGERNNVAGVTLPILPTEQADFPTLVAPFQCFTNEKAACLGYAILKAELRPHADKFGVHQDPDIKDCVRRLLSSPPKSRLDAEQKFSYLAGRSSELNHFPALVDEIRSAKIVPIFRQYYLGPQNSGFEDPTKQQTGKTEYRIHHYDSPDTIFVGRDEEYKGIIDYVQYSSEATAFLLNVGAKHEPSSHDLASLVCADPWKFRDSLGHDRYLNLLRKLAEHTETLWKDKDLVRRMAASRMLLGYSEIKDDKKKPVPEEEEMDDFEEMDSHREHGLHRANELVIVDDVQYLTSFRYYIVIAPQEEQLEEFYAKLGTKKLSETIKIDRRIGVPTRDQSKAHELRKDILERARLFLHDYERDASSKSIRHDAKWLSTNLTVQCVSDISNRYSLAGRNVTLSSNKTAAIEKGRSSYVLNITPKYDFYDVARELAKLLVRKPKQNDVIALERILSEPLRRLQARGINVERILKRQEIETRAARQQEQKREQEEQRQRAEMAKALPPPNEKGSLLQPEPETPEKAPKMPGSFGTPDHADTTDPEEDNGLISNWTKKLFKNATNDASNANNAKSITKKPAPRPSTDGPQINKDIASTRSNIANAIKECRPASTGEHINTKHHQDPTELDNGGYCSGEQWENLHKAFTVPYSGRSIDIYFGRSQSETARDLQAPLSSFLPLIFGLTTIFGVDPSAVNIFLDAKSNTVAFNMNGSLFFNMAWFMGLHAKDYGTVEGRQRACDSWFLTYCHELAHNLVKDHNARHNWYNQQIAIEFAMRYRAALNGFLLGLAN
jgi:hypothetical protein